MFVFLIYELSWNDKVHKTEKKLNSYIQAMTHAKFQKERYKTVGAVAYKGNAYI